MQIRRYSYGSICSEDGDFRLLRLAKDLTDGKLTGSMVSASLDDIPQYKTISYYWGDRADAEDILVDGALLTIPVNAANCLRLIRSRGDEQLLWIDTVCIDQSSLSERGAQVSNMGRVYASAECNLIYLGEQDFTPAYEAITAINKEIMEDTDGFVQLSDQLRPDNCWTESHAPLRTPLVHAELEQLFELPWFKRVWVLQEASLARRNVCLSGGDDFDLLPIVRAGVWLAHKETVMDLKNLSNGADRMLGFFDLVDHEQGWYAKNPYCFEQLIRMASGSLCTLPVDRVYAVRGIMEKHNVPGWQQLRPDYTIPKERIFETAMRIVLAEGDGNMLGLCQVCHVNALEWQPGRKMMPSWAQDWTTTPEASRFAQLLSPRFDACNGSHQINHFLTEDDNFANGILNLSGISVDYVEKLLDPMDIQRIPDRHAIPGIMDEIEAALRIHFTDAVKLETALAQLPSTAMAVGPSVYRDQQPELFRSWSLFRDTVHGLRREPRGSVADDAQAQQSRTCCHYCTETLRNRTLVISRSGSLGLAPFVAQEGDKIVILDGLSWPAYLRPVEDGYQFVGVGYFYGVMEGKWKAGQTDLGRPKEWFKLV